MAQVALRLRRRDEHPQGRRRGCVPLIGFAGSPWTLACYMVEGGAGRLPARQDLLYNRPDLMHRILAVTADAVAGLPERADRAGAQAVMIFDSWGGVLADGAFQAFSLAYTGACSGAAAPRARGQRIPRIVFTRAAALARRHRGATAAGRDRPGLDHESGQGACPRRPGHRAAGQLIDPNVLFASPEQVAAEAIKVLDSYGPPGHGSGRLQPRPRHQPAHAAGERGRARGCGACIRAACDTRLMAPKGFVRRVCQPCFPDCPQAGLALKCAKSGPRGLDLSPPDDQRPPNRLRCALHQEILPVCP